MIFLRHVKGKLFSCGYQLFRPLAVIVMLGIQNTSLSQDFLLFLVIFPKYGSSPVKYCSHCQYNYFASIMVSFSFIVISFSTVSWSRLAISCYLLVVEFALVSNLKKYG